MKKITAFGIIILGLLGIASGRSDSIRFKHISLDDGLSQNSVFCILQDSKGFMWFGTQDGLNKYDGYNFTIYKREPGNRNSLNGARVNALCEDPSGILWIGTDSGLNRFDPRTETFYRYRTTPNTPDGLNNPTINALCPDRRGALWIGTNGGGLSRLTHEPGGKETFTHFKGTPGYAASQGGDFVTSIIEDQSGTIWAATFGGLIKFDPASEAFTCFRHSSDDPNSLNSNRLTVVYEDRSGLLWIGTNGDGLNIFDRKNGTFVHYPAEPDVPGGLGSGVIYCIHEDQSGVLWVGTLQGGLNRFDKRSESFTRFSRNPRDPYSLSNNSITTIYEDRSRILWMGTPGGGLNKFDRDHKFDHYKADPDNPAGLSDSFAYAILEDRSGILWIGTSDAGLDKFDRRKDTVTNYRWDPNDPGSLGANLVRAVYEDSSGVIWVGTWGAGLNKFNRETETFTRYTSDPFDPRSLSGNLIITILEDRKGRFWVGTLGGGLNRFDRETGTSTRYRHDPANLQSLSDDLVYCLYESPSEPGIIWIGTRSGGLNRFDPDEGTWERFRENPDDPRSLSSNDIVSLLEDSSGTFWVGTYGGGLNKLIRKKKGRWECVRYTEKNGLVNNAIYGVLEDPEGCLWISSNRGLTRFDPKTETFKNYTPADGLQGNEFNGGAYFKSKRGEMFFGGLNGVNAFFPSKLLRKNPYVPPVVITTLKLFNNPVPVARASDESPLREALPWAEELRLSYKQNVLSFEFAALDFTTPGSNQYAYKMEGFDEDWVYTGSGHRLASYTNLAPGEYVFRVRGSNNDGIWNEEGASLRVMITPPYWATWWFRSFLAFAVIGLVFIWYRRRLKNVRLKAELQTARDAQLSIMPRSDPAIEGFDISGVCVPAGEVGGDFFDYIWLNEEKTKLGIVIGDVSGKAMKSAMTAIMISGMIYSTADEYRSVKEIMRRVNRPFYFKTEKKVFTALCLASLDLQTREITFSNAGLHEPLLKSGNSVSKLKGEGNRLPLGVRMDSIYLEKKQQLRPGDVIVFFTDGVTETRNPDGRFYGLEALKALIEITDVVSLTSGAFKDKIISEVGRFSGGAPQHDDMTIVVVKVN